MSDIAAGAVCAEGAEFTLGRKGMGDRKWAHSLESNVLDHARTDFVRLGIDQTVAEALKQIQKSKTTGRIVYFYVVDDKDRLQGVLPTRRLLMSSPETPIRDLMVKQVITLPATATLHEACEFFILHRLLAFPIVDAEGHILGVVDVEHYTDEISDLAHRQESEDVFQLIGVRMAEFERDSIPSIFASRFPWLLCNIFGGLAAAFVAGFFQATLDEVVVLALFIPVVLALAESVSIQSLTLTLQAQHRPKPTWEAWLRSLVREVPVGLLLGLGCAVCVAGVAWLWKRDAMVAWCILLSILGSVTTATLFGVLVPTTLRAVRKDPQIASGPITLALTDLVTLFYYLGLATVMLT